MKQNKQQRLSKLQQMQMLEASKKQRNLADLQNTMNKLMVRLDEWAYKIETTKDKKKKKALEEKFDKTLNLVISLQQGNFSVETH